MLTMNHVFSHFGYYSVGCLYRFLRCSYTCVVGFSFVSLIWLEKRVRFFIIFTMGHLRIGYIVALNLFVIFFSSSMSTQPFLFPIFQFAAKLSLHSSCRPFPICLIIGLQTPPSFRQHVTHFHHLPTFLIYHTHHHCPRQPWYTHSHSPTGRCVHAWCYFHSA